MALDASIQITGAKQGVFKHQGQIKSRAGFSVATRVDYGIASPRDSHTGLATGKREHSPVRVELPIDSSSINIATATANNETLTKVLINFYQNTTAGLMQGTGPGSGGEAKPFYTLELTNAVFSKFSLVMPQSRTSDPELKNKDIHVSIEMTFQKIVLTWCEGGITFADDWTLGSMS